MSFRTFCGFRFTKARPFSLAAEHSYDQDIPATSEPWNIPLIADAPEYRVECVEGVFNVYKSQEGFDNEVKLDYAFPSIKQYIQDIITMMSMITNGPMKSFCYRRLSYLSNKFQLHVLLNEIRELAAQKAVSHRDFYNLRKVDTHVHAASCMNQKHLLRLVRLRRSDASFS